MATNSCFNWPNQDILEQHYLGELSSYACMQQYDYRVNPKMLLKSTSIRRKVNAESNFCIHNLH